MSVLLVTLWSRREQIDTWKHPQTTSSCCRRKLPYFCGHVPQESGTNASGSLVKTDPKDLGMLIKLPIEDSLGCSFRNCEHSR